MKGLKKFKNIIYCVLVIVLVFALFNKISNRFGKIFADECEEGKHNYFMTEFDWKSGSTTIIEKTFTCKICGHQYTTEIDFEEIFNGSGSGSTEGPTEPTTHEHNYVNGICTECGAKDPDYEEPATSVAVDSDVLKQALDSLIPDKTAILTFSTVKVKPASLPNSVDISENADGSLILYVTGTGLRLFSQGGKQVKVIGDLSGLFSDYTNMTSVDFSNMIIEASDTTKMFYNCTNLTSIDLSNFKLTSIGNQMFANAGIQSITVPEGVTKIEESAFQDSKLESVDLPNSLIEISKNAFYNSKISSITIPENCEAIGQRAFAKSQLQRFEVVEENQSFKADNGILMTNDGTKIVSYPTKKNGTLYTMQDGVTDIEAYAFEGVTGVERIVLSQDMEMINEYAFAYCTSLNTIDIAKVEEIGDYAFYNCTSFYGTTVNNKNLTLPNVKSIGKQAFSGCNINIVNIQSSHALTTIGAGAFSDCTSLTSVSLLKDDITIDAAKVEDAPFYNCINISSFRVNSSTSGAGWGIYWRYKSTTAQHNLTYVQ